MRAHRSSIAEPIVELGFVRDSAAALLARALFHGLTNRGQDDGLLARYANPALLVDGNHRVIAANVAAAPLAQALIAGRTPDLARLISRSVADNTACHEEISHPCDDGGTVETAVLPTGDGLTALVLCHDVTLDRHLRAALSESRERYKDLVEVVSDFAWETGADGCFRFVSPRGALGYTAAELIGRPTLDLVVRVLDRGGEPPASPFVSRETMMDTQVWVRRRDGAMALLSMSAVPLFDADGGWCGARGICRDVTDTISSDADGADLRARGGRS